MTLTDFLIKAHTALDRATVEDGLGNEALCMIHLGMLHGLLLLFHEGHLKTAARTCRVCGCSDLNACPEGCYWVEPGLCSQCVTVDVKKPVSVRQSKSNHKS